MDKDTAARLRDRRVPRYFGDDPEFLEIVEYYVWRFSAGFKPKDLFVIRVDNWFDRKWLGFSGKVPYVFSYGEGLPDVATTQPVWKHVGSQAATFPPFVPNRIVRETHLKAADGWVSRTGSPKSIHPLEKVPSRVNLDRKILSSFEDAVLIWFSSRSEANGRGTLMFYRARDKKAGGFWSSFLRKDRWQVDRTVNVDRELLVRDLAWLSEDES